MTTYCLVDQTRDVLSLLNDDGFPGAAELVRRIRAGAVFDIGKEEERQVCWFLYTKIREQAQGRGRWAEKSPLRDVIDRQPLIWRTGNVGKRECLARLPGAGPEPTEAQYHEAVLHRWVQAQLVELGWHFEQARSESELHVPGGDIDVAWDEVAWEVDFSIQTPADQQKRHNVRAAAGFQMVALLDDSVPRNEMRSVVPEVYLSQLKAAAQAAVDGDHASLAKLIVTNAYKFDFRSATWIELKRLTFKQFCDALVHGRAHYGQKVSGGWHTKSCQKAAALRARAPNALLRMRRSCTEHEQQLAAARKKLARLEDGVESLVALGVVLSKLDLQRASDVAQLHAASAAQALVPEVVRATSLVWTRRHWWSRLLNAFRLHFAEGRRTHDRLAKILRRGADLSKRRIAQWKAALASRRAEVELASAKLLALQSTKLEFEKALTGGDLDTLERLLTDVGDSGS